jgi:hypothetical protein
MPLRMTHIAIYMGRLPVADDLSTEQMTAPLPSTRNVAIPLHGKSPGHSQGRSISTDVDPRAGGYILIGNRLSRLQKQSGFRGAEISPVELEIDR